MAVQSGWSPLGVGSTGQDRVAFQPTPPIVLSANETLADYAKIGRWFSYALAMTWLSRPADPLVDLLARRADLGVRVFVHQKPFFNGVGSRRMPHWNHALFWVPEASWHLIDAHLQVCVFRDHPRTVFSRAIQLTVPDQPLLAKSAVLPENPRVPAVLYGLRCQEWQTRTVPPENVWDPVQVIKEDLPHGNQSAPAQRVRG